MYFHDLELKSIEFRCLFRRLKIYHHFLFLQNNLTWNYLQAEIQVYSLAFSSPVFETMIYGIVPMQRCTFLKGKIVLWI